MDQSYDGVDTRAQNATPANPTSARPSFEPRSPRIPGTRPHTHSHNVFGHTAQSSTAGALDYNPYAHSRRGGSTSGGVRPVQGDRNRKGSIRNAMMKIFGRRSREVPPSSPQGLHNSPGHYRSEALTLETQQEAPELEKHFQTTDQDVTERVLSTSFPIAPSMLQEQHRNGSPYAVQFPNSVRLKPMALSNPFDAPGSQLRRRKTLPSVQHAASTASTAATVVPELPSPLPSRPPTFVASAARRPETSGSRLVGVRTSKHAKRKSRSLDDMRAASTSDSSPQRKRSEEIRYWRDSFQTETARAKDAVEGSAKEPPRRPERGPDDLEIPMLQTAGTPHKKVIGLAPSQIIGYENTPPPSDPDAIAEDRMVYSPSGTDMSRDLEERVARLEAGLQNFQRSLQRMTIGSKQMKAAVQRTAGSPTRALDDLDTPSMLADTLQHTLAPSSYEYEYGHTMRPATSPRSSMLPAPQTPPRYSGVFDSFGPRFSTTSHHRHQVSNSSSVGASSSSRSLPNVYRNPSPPPPLPTGVPVPPLSTNQSPSVSTALDAALSQADQTSTAPQHTFRSLYQMLADERSARRKLESQLKTLQREISSLHNQVAFSSTSSVANAHSQRNSAHAAQFGLHPAQHGASPSVSYANRGEEFSSSRLRDLLLEVERSGEERGEDHSRMPEYEHHLHYEFQPDLDKDDLDAGSSRYTHQRPTVVTSFPSHTYPQLLPQLHAHSQSLQQPVVSRFSGSESEAGATEVDLFLPDQTRHPSTIYAPGRRVSSGINNEVTDEDDIPTPYEAYQTPCEDRPRGSDGATVGAMF